MLRLKAGAARLTWGERDMVAMTKIIGAECAVQRKSPAIVSIIKAADHIGVPLNRRAKTALVRHQNSVDHARNIVKAKNAPVLTPLAKKAFGHQRVALWFYEAMQRNGYLCADKTGVGKTLQFLLWAHTRPEARRILIVVKNIGKEQWANAITHWIGPKEKVTVVDGSVADQLRQIRRTNSRWVVAHWESLVHARAAFLEQAWSVVGLDEGHMMNNRKTQRAGTVHKLDATHRMIMTAHPFSKDAGELFSLLRFLEPTLYTSYWRFFHMHVRSVPKAFGGYEILGTRRPKLLQWELAPFTIMRTKQDVFKSLPHVAFQSVPVSLSTRGAAEYQRLRKQIFVELEALGGGTVTIPIINDMVSVTRARQYLVDPGLIGAREKSLKYEAVYDLLEGITDPVVVFTSFRQAALRLAAFLKKRKLRTKVLHGGMTKQVEGIKRQFQARTWDALICVDRAADTSLNLGGFGYVVHLDLPFLPRDYEQAFGRVDRPQENTGKLVPTTAYRVIVRDSYEERLEAKLKSRDKTFRDVFTVADLRGLFE